MTLPIAATPNGKKRLFMKVIQRRLRYPPTAGIEEEVREPEHYELKSPVDPDY